MICLLFFSFSGVLQAQQQEGASLPVKGKAPGATDTYDYVKTSLPVCYKSAESKNVNTQLSDRSGPVKFASPVIKLHSIPESKEATRQNCLANEDTVIVSFNCFGKGQLRIIDEESGLPVAGATVVASGRKKAVSMVADTNGVVNNSLLSKQILHYKVSCTGYEAALFTAASVDSSAGTIRLKRSYRPMDEIKIIAYTVTRTSCLACLLPVSDECMVRCKNIRAKKKAEKKPDPPLPTYSVYPNPLASSGTLNLVVSQAFEGRLELFSMAGQLVLRREVKAEKGIASFSLPQLSRGIYQLRITEGKGEVMHKEKLLVQ